MMKTFLAPINFQKKADKVLKFFVVITRRIMFASFFKRKEI